MEITDKKNKFQGNDRRENHSGGFKRVGENRQRGFMESWIRELFLKKFSKTY